MSRHRTPLRYPGGKQRLTPFIIEILSKNQLIGGHYVEPYAGGAGVALQLLLGNYVSHIYINDISRPIYAFWTSVLTHTDALCDRILRASLTVEEWKKHRAIVRHPDEHDDLTLGFSTFYLNRCNRSGILSGGVIGGLNQDGRWKIDARFSKQDLIRRIAAIGARSTDITVTNQDAETFIQDYIPTLPQNTFVYCDPPYFAKSSQLYLNRYTKADHERLARIIQEQLVHKWIVSYDSAVEISNLYDHRRSFLYDLQHNAREAHQGTEVFIFSDTLRVPQRSSLTYIQSAIETCTFQFAPIAT